MKDQKLAIQYNVFTNLMYRRLMKGEEEGKSGWEDVPKTAVVAMIKATVGSWEDRPSSEKIADVANLLLFLHHDQILTGGE